MNFHGTICNPHGHTVPKQQEWWGENRCVRERLFVSVLNVCVSLRNESEQGDWDEAILFQ